MVPDYHSDAQKLDRCLVKCNVKIARLDELFRTTKGSLTLTFSRMCYSGHSKINHHETPA